MDALNTATTFATNGNRQIPMPETSISQTPRKAAPKGITSTDMATKRDEPERKSLWEENAKLLGAVLGLISLVTVVYTGAYKFASYEFQINKLQSDIQELKSQKEQDFERKVNIWLQEASTNGYKIAKAEAEKEKENKK
jgi:uncharacterized membrane protein